VETTPAVSILLPVHNAESTLIASIDSIRAQTLAQWECIAVDDRSSDRSLEILQAWVSRDPARVRVISAPPPGGIVAALEEARGAARAPLLARQDADDRSLPTRLEKQWTEMQDTGGDLAVLGCLTVPGGADPTEGMRRYLDWLDACARTEGACEREIWIESPIAHPTAMMRARAIAAAGGYREMGWPEDYDLWLRIHRAGMRIASLPQRLYEWTDHPDRLSRRDPRYAPDAFLRCRLHHLRRWLDERGILAGERPLIVWGAGRDGRRLARAWDEEARTPGPTAPPVAAFVDIDPRKIGRARGGRPILDFHSVRRAFPDAFYLAAVGVEGARDLIRESLTKAGILELRDFICLH